MSMQSYFRSYENVRNEVTSRATVLEGFLSESFRYFPNCPDCVQCPNIIILSLARPGPGLAATIMIMIPINQIAAAARGTGTLT